MDATDGTIDLSATLELRPNTGHSYGRSLNKRAGRSFSSVSTRKRAASGGGGGGGGGGERATTPSSSLYQSRFHRTTESGARGPVKPSPPPQRQQVQQQPAGAAAVSPPPPEQAWAEEGAWAQEQLSDKDQRRYEHEQSQMELMQFIEQLRTVRRTLARVARVLRGGFSVCVARLATRAPADARVARCCRAASTINLCT
jgi:hypothetical protein